MEELAIALERETLNSIGGNPCPPPKMGRPKINLPKPIVKRIRSDVEKAREKAMRKKKASVSASYHVIRIERMMALACPKRKRYAV